MVVRALLFCMKTKKPATQTFADFGATRGYVATWRLPATALQAATKAT